MDLAPLCKIQSLLLYPIAGVDGKTAAEEDGSFSTAFPGGALLHIEKGRLVHAVRFLFWYTMMTSRQWL